MDVDEKERKQEQVKMHRSAIDCIDSAIANGFYLEAIFQEYAAMEGRLEVICGILGMPCNKEAGKKGIFVPISNRRKCIEGFFNNCPKLFERSKLSASFFSKDGPLDNWIAQRNDLIHSLLKDEVQYSNRMKNAHKLALDGRQFTSRLYNEAKRLNRLSKGHPEQLAIECGKCSIRDCEKGVLKRMGEKTK